MFANMKSGVSQFFSMEAEESSDEDFPETNETGGDYSCSEAEFADEEDGLETDEESEEEEVFEKIPVFLDSSENDLSDKENVSPLTPMAPRTLKQVKPRLRLMKKRGSRVLVSSDSESEKGTFPLICLSSDTEVEEEWSEMECTSSSTPMH